MRTLKVSIICGKHCLAPDEGEALFKEIYGTLQKGEDVLLDFNGVDTLASSFLNTAVGRLFGKFDYGFLDARLQWVGLDQQDERVLRLVIENAKEHFQKSEAEREITAKIVRRAIGE